MGLSVGRAFGASLISLLSLVHYKLPLLNLLGQHYINDISIYNKPLLGGGQEVFHNCNKTIHKKSISLLKKTTLQHLMLSLQSIIGMNQICHQTFIVTTLHPSLLQYNNNIMSLCWSLKNVFMPCHLFEFRIFDLLRYSHQWMNEWATSVDRQTPSRIDLYHAPTTNKRNTALFFRIWVRYP